MEFVFCRDYFSTEVGWFSITSCLYFGAFCVGILDPSRVGKEMVKNHEQRNLGVLLNLHTNGNIPLLLG